MATIFYRQILKGRKQRQPENTAVCTEGCKEGGHCQIYTSISLWHSGSVLQGSFPSRCWSSCPCQGRGFEVDTALGGRCSPTGPRPHKFCGWKPVCSLFFTGRAHQHCQEAPTPSVNMLVDIKTARALFLSLGFQWLSRTWAKCHDASEVHNISIELKCPILL